MLDTIRNTIFSTISIALLASAALGFGGEDLTKGNPWHHEDITKRALTGEDPYRRPGFKSSASSIAWVADNIDSYLYNPIFWLEGGPTRIRASLLGYEELAKLHFDDTFSTAGLQATWQRYASGTLAGLYWASLQGVSGDVAAGQNILGVSLHAIQDFSSHSNWVDDPERSCLTYLQTEVKSRESMSLYSGAYERPRAGAQHHHGKYSFGCSVLRGDSMDSMMKAVCSGFSPVQNLGFCESFRVCNQEGDDVSISLDGDAKTGWVYLNPKGIALDNLWLTRIQAANRNLIKPGTTDFVDLKGGTHFSTQECKTVVNAKTAQQACEQDADFVFAMAKELAIRSSLDWLAYLEEKMTQMGPRQAEFWEFLKAQPLSKTAAAKQFEELSKLPYQFLTAGPYPVGNPSTAGQDYAKTAEGWYLRLNIKTMDEVFAGTDADIYADVTMEDGTVKSHLLDYMRTSDSTARVNSPLLVFNDFEMGSDVVYTIGPFPSRPKTMAFRNDNAEAIDVVGAIWTDFKNGLSNGATTSRRLLLGLIGGNSDFVDSAYETYTYDQLQAFFAGDKDKKDGFYRKELIADGGDEGRHKVTFRLLPKPEALTELERNRNWLAFEIKLHELKTLKEAKVDGGSFSDEPFVIVHFAPHNGIQGDSSTYLSPALVDMDEGETHVFPRRTGSSRIVKIPPRVGGFALGIQVYESDNENAYDRDQLRRTFESGFDEDMRKDASLVLKEIGRILAEDWSLDSVKAFAFYRGASPQAGPVLSETDPQEIAGGETGEAFTFDWSNVKTLIPEEGSISKWHAEPSDAFYLHGQWDVSNVPCDGKSFDVPVTIKSAGYAINMFAAENTPCMSTGDRLFSGSFDEGVMSGIYMPPLNSKTDAIDAALDSDSAGTSEETPPIFRDPAFDPNYPFEGNWQIVWDMPENEPDLIGFGTLERHPNGEWGVRFLLSNGRVHKGTIEFDAAGKMKTQYGYSMLGNWGGASEVVPTLNEMNGTWTYNDRSGSETWTRIEPVIESVAPVSNGQQGDASPLGSLATVSVRYKGPEYEMRGNRPRVSLRILGQGLWGHHNIWLSKSSGLELTAVDYVCARGETGYATHPDAFTCLQQGGVLGMDFEYTVWPDAKSGPIKLHINDQVVPFILAVLDHPDETADSQTMQVQKTMSISMDSCIALRAIDGDDDLLPMKFLRSGTH